MGATGKVGRHVVAQLREWGHPLRAVARSSPDRFDWADRSTWQPALAKVDTVYLNVWGVVGVVAPAEFTRPAVRSGVRRIVALSGPRTMTFADVVAQIGEGTGREIRHVPVQESEYVQHLVSRGYDRTYVEMLAGPFRWLHRGNTGFLSDGVLRATGREPRDFTDYARLAAATGVGGRGEAVN